MYAISESVDTPHWCLFYYLLCPSCQSGAWVCHLNSDWESQVVGTCAFYFKSNLSWIYLFTNILLPNMTWRLLQSTSVVSCCVWARFIWMLFHREQNDQISHITLRSESWKFFLFFFLISLYVGELQNLFQCTGKSVLMCQHQVNSMSLLFIKLPVPLHIIYVSSVMLLQGTLLKEKRNRYLAKKRWFWLQKSTYTYWQRKNRHVLPKKQITRPIFKAYS